MYRFITLIAILFISHGVNACQVTETSLDEKYDRAEKIYIGKLTKAELIEENQIRKKLKLTYKVIESFKGPVKDVEIVYTAISLTACGLGPTGFYYDHLIYTGKNSIASSPPSIALNMDFTASGVTYSEESMEWISFLRNKSSNKSKQSERL